MIEALLTIVNYTIYGVLAFTVFSVVMGIWIAVEDHLEYKKHKRLTDKWVEEQEINPVPLEEAFKTKVKYKYSGDMKPIPYKLDGDEQNND